MKVLESLVLQPVIGPIVAAEPTGPFAAPYACGRCAYLNVADWHFASDDDVGFLAGIGRKADVLAKKTRRGGYIGGPRSS